jgi:hypothetical protein
LFLEYCCGIIIAYYVTILSMWAMSQSKSHFTLCCSQLESLINKDFTIDVAERVLYSNIKADEEAKVMVRGALCIASSIAQYDLTNLDKILTRWLCVCGCRLPGWREMLIWTDNSTNTVDRYIICASFV